ncbi:hypothetical protein PQ469_24960 [Mucilaginibacter sp. KACC 22773]|uniref:hypothetical protein n=1 Tax=Mucilaginibacter sp. KACC 22773 TaxID=3025671 RepID=UPI0023652B79|nr:hypothetical protein [Mucilaginibacter sp. KACC 22773]WDF77140.1 hypothetical protein PQ469_24960 [Mucilaginibacter sp. KACC 22773]
MRTANDKGLIKERNQQLWKLHQQIAHFAKDLDRLPDAQEARLNRPKSAPQHLLPMVF